MIPHVYRTTGLFGGTYTVRPTHPKGSPPVFKTPDITPAQIVGLVTALVGTLVAFGVNLTADQQHVLIADAGIIAAIVIGDGIVRHGRATGNARRD